jgi:hypothetical protein
MDWFKGQFTGKPHISWENLKIYGFRLRFSSTNQSIDGGMIVGIQQVDFYGAWQVVVQTYVSSQKHYPLVN